MNTPENSTVTIVGAGLAGSLLAILLARRGVRTEVFERLPDMRSSDVPAGRSINLALAERGIHALQRAGAHEHLSGFAIPMRGRMVHPVRGEPELQPYGIRPDEVIHAVHRARLNETLLTLADAHPEVRIHFDQELVTGDLDAGELTFRDLKSGERRAVRVGPVIGADGAGSPLRGLIDKAAGTRTESELLDHCYKELTIPPGPDGQFRLDPNALHIWPRGGYMLIALPNSDHSFTATLFLPERGEPGFGSLGDDGSVRRFFTEQFPDAVAHIPRLTRDFAERPTGVLGTVRCPRWHHGNALVLGDAAHAIVPFHGQGMNCAFEDCEVLDDIVGEQGFSGHWEQAFAEFQRQREENARAIAAMALENYVEMRDSVRDSEFLLKKDLERLLERHFPSRFVPRYAMVMFRRIPYAEARRRGALQSEILERLAEGIETTQQADLELAGNLVREKLTPLPPDP